MPERMTEAINGAPLVGAPWAGIHAPSKCLGGRCPLHRPTDHHMALWPLVIRSSGLIERLCTHQVGHPDPDSLTWIIRETGETGWGTHGCDGCCAGPELVPA